LGANSRLRDFHSAQDAQRPRLVPPSRGKTPIPPNRPRRSFQQTLTSVEWVKPDARHLSPTEKIAWKFGVV